MLQKDDKVIDSTVLSARIQILEKANLCISFYLVFSAIINFA